MESTAMLVISITADEHNPLDDVSPAHSDGLPAVLAHYGVPAALIQQALSMLSQYTTLLLCKPSDTDEWKMQQRCG
jgi:hypothetical protein